MKQQHIYQLLYSASERINNYLSSVLKRFNITPQQAYALSFICDSDNAISFKMLKIKMKLSAPSITGLVRRLQRSGYVNIESDPSDARIQVIRLTDSGRDVYNKAHILIEDFDRYLKGSLFSCELNSFHGFIHLIENEINKLNLMQKTAGQKHHALR